MTNCHESVICKYLNAVVLQSLSLYYLKKNNNFDELCHTEISFFVCAS